MHYSDPSLDEADSLLLLGQTDSDGCFGGWKTCSCAQPPIP